MDINGDNVNLINSSVQKILIIIKTISSLILSLAVLIIIWLTAIILISRPDMILCRNGDFCNKMNATLWTCLTNQSKFYLTSQLVDLISSYKQKSCFMSYQSIESIYNCQPKLACSYKMVVLLNAAFIEVGASWFMLSSLTTYFRPNQFDLRRAQEVLSLNKYIIAFLIFISTSLYRIHSGSCFYEQTYSKLNYMSSY